MRHAVQLALVRPIRLEEGHPSAKADVRARAQPPAFRGRVDAEGAPQPAAAKFNCSARPITPRTGTRRKDLRIPIGKSCINLNRAVAGKRRIRPPAKPTRPTGNVNPGAKPPPTRLPALPLLRNAKKLWSE